MVAAKETGTEAPVKRIESCSFLYTRHLNMYFVALTRSNVNPALVFEYIFQLIKILKAYLGEDFDENSMRNNMTLIYELMDETMDFGYPQVRRVVLHCVVVHCIGALYCIGVCRIHC